MMKAAIIVAQAALTLLSMPTEAKTNPLQHNVTMAEKGCTDVLAGMYNDAKAEPGVVVEYTGITLTLQGKGLEYVMVCEAGYMKFAGSVKMRY